MTAVAADRIPVIVAIGEVADRPTDPAAAREPVVLMADALRAAEADAGVPLLSALGSIEVVGLISWPYKDPVGLLCEKLGIAPARAINASMGGETPIRLVHDAALRIAAGSNEVAAIVGGESVNAVQKAQKSGAKLDWTPPCSRDEQVKLDFSKLPMSAAAKAAGAVAPVHIYPFYENAVQAVKGVTPAQGRKASAELWARYAKVAADNPYAWLRNAPSAEEIGEVSVSNRPISFPYTKFNVANMIVNQSGAVVVASLAWARAAGIPEDKLIHIWGGAAAAEPGDYMERDDYTHSSAQRAVLEKAVEVAGGDAAKFDLAELYSCFPVVPKMAIEIAGLRPEVEPTTAGGLTFFGGPLNNYMTHGLAGMVRKLRNGEGKLGLVYGQGGVVSKHHAIVVSTEPAPAPLAPSYKVQDRADAERGPVPEVTEDYAGPATIETWTVIHKPDGSVQNGAVIARTPEGKRLIASVPADDTATIAVLTDMERNAVGRSGTVSKDAEGKMIWRDAA
ncbi:acetyl-CoA acetyltransferase [Novosphingobium sp. KCTC 2891]|uniref:acetyl-CoA acetyltransferase n=1 Tax=Novosphingobium sp. KCTC 2891 TaxID=2989730 RepID=UPI002221A24A|nr:acetyl-CoA acetyltransferase [Novosphingobium sp. KCTC 2891]MCW1382930.1 acetyl-CoA acetyltransferase [Novosphingobium sp. KCTC 2891]